MDSLPPGIDLCQIPAGTPPSGVPNFENPTSLGPALTGITVTMMVVTLAVLTSRLWINRRHLSKADACAIVAFISSVAYSGLILSSKLSLIIVPLDQNDTQSQLVNKYMRHQWDTPACWFNATYVKLTCVMQILMPLSHMFSKIAILLLLSQVFSISKPMRIAIYAGIVGVILGYGPNFILGPVFTVPRSGEKWEDLIVNERPKKLVIVGLQQAALAVLLDLYIFVLPFPLLSQLNLNFKKRVQLGILFGTAFMGVVASIIGLVLRVPLLKTKDASWVQGQVFICIMVEVYIAIICSCLPAFTKFTKTYISSTPFYRSLSSLVWSREPRGDEHTDESLKIATIGGSEPVKTGRKKRGLNYHEVHDMSVLNTNWTSDSANEASVVALETDFKNSLSHGANITATYHVSQSFSPKEHGVAPDAPARSTHSIV